MYTPARERGSNHVSPVEFGSRSPELPQKARAQRRIGSRFRLFGVFLMALRDYVPPPKKAIGYAVLAFVVVVITTGLGMHSTPATWVASAKAHVQSLFAKLKAKLKPGG